MESGRGRDGRWDRHGASCRRSRDRWRDELAVEIDTSYELKRFISDACLVSRSISMQAVIITLQSTQ